MPVCGANPANLSPTAPRANLEQAYSQFMLKTGGEATASFGLRQKWKRLRHWLCSSHLLLRESP
jgi:hypothetical protein